MPSYKSIATPDELKKQYPLTLNHQIFIEKSKETVKNILDGKDSRKLLVVGPCSIHDTNVAIEYAKLLKKLMETVSDEFFIVMRAYYEKPRTSHGWKGFLYDPHLDETDDIAQGFVLTRKLLLELSDLEIPLATEFLDPIASLYFDDLITWGCIGARTVSSQTHRQIASCLNVSIGFKNTTSGDVEPSIQGILACSKKQSFIGMNQQGFVSQILSDGNLHTHLVLRGSELNTNYDPQSITETLEKLKKYNLKERLLVDCSHGNSKKEHEKQIVVFQSLIAQILEGNVAIKGMLIESNIYAGKQKNDDKDQLTFGVSITDSCLDFKTLESMILWGYEKLKLNADVSTKAQELVLKL